MLFLNTYSELNQLIGYSLSKIVTWTYLAANIGSTLVSNVV